ncbi:hypothetical protein CEUSTIGMA_g1236.t1 [Chlamydomonas eustigma]|uniref:Glutaredoxin domain-containing protein n=1 Tax=Chlamydomonas eustigma TaxID=1157962 RepID=A0A250WSH4_9CHLO|nr:hypothetical protein CEUSTIGMA_g1236.t1 [Chlamydomonas eustigma]|eukprot:GAX73785.1 hypothetical protein CEUSTIGMA_g1236.t1 [Chlamydomonas eustigma]
MAAKELVSQTVASSKVVVFSKTYCPYCTKAKNALKQFLTPEQFTVLELDQRDDGDDIQAALGEMTGAKSVPRVFVGGKFIGGGDDTARMAGNGELKNLLTSVGAM